MPLTYKSFCWCLGTTSFRTKNFNRTIEEQLGLLNEFWSKPDNADISWRNNNNIQTEYYLFMQEKGFVEGDADNKPKDAREKTSGLVDIGLIDDNRRPTNVGKALLAISESNDFGSDNHFEIPKDSFIYLKQLLKTSCVVDGNTVRPLLYCCISSPDWESFQQMSLHTCCRFVRARKPPMKSSPALTI